MAAAYSESDKALACEMVDRFDGEITKDCLAAIRKALAAPKLHKTTVWRWYQARAVATGLQPEKSAQQAAAAKADRALDDYFEETAHAYLQHANKEDVIAKVSGPQAVTAAAISVDKMRLLRNMPTEIIDLWPGFMKALEDLNLSAADVFNAIIAQARAVKAEYDDHS